MSHPHSFPIPHVYDSIAIVPPMTSGQGAAQKLRNAPEASETHVCSANSAQRSYPT
jgi:hypothetical protein